jgi:phosphoribosyl-ATP pyrophosphohydrolase
MITRPSGARPFDPELPMSAGPSVLAQLMSVIEDRRARRPTGSYTVQLLAGGSEAIGAKVLEEARELVEAARAAGPGGRQPVIHEAADLLYHLLVLLAHGGVLLDEVEAELARRFGVSGLEEKARRSE